MIAFFLSPGDRAAYIQKARERKRKRTAKRKELGMGPDRRTIVAQLDHLFSLYIRRRDRKVAAGRCVICLKNPIEHCFHWISRANYSTRWDPENACGSCRGCNFAEHLRPIKYRAIHVALIGAEKRGALEAKALTPAKFSTADLIALRDEIKAKLEARL